MINGVCSITTNHQRAAIGINSRVALDSRVQLFIYPQALSTCTDVGNFGLEPGGQFAL